jgi:S1-C subfamily serine protease
MSTPSVSRVSPSVLLAGLCVLGIAVSQGVVLRSLASVQQRLASAEERLRTQEYATSTAPIVPEVVTPAVSLNRVYSLPEALRGGRVSPTLPLFKKDPRDAERLSLEQVDGFAIALTNDGWIALPATALPSKKLSDVRIGWRGKLYTPTQGMIDTATGIAFVRIPAQDLPIAALTTKADIAIGQGVWIEDRRGGYSVSSLERIDQSTGGVVVSSDTWNKRFFLSGLRSTSAAVWDERGRLVGVALDDEALLPAEALRTALTSILAKGDIRRPSLGVTYVDTAYTYTAQEGAPVRGAIVSLDKKLPANAPVRQWLRDGDVIERIERDVLDANWSLAERLAEYQATATVTVAGQRQGVPFEVRATLAERVTSEVLTP